MNEEMIKVDPELLSRVLAAAVSFDGVIKPGADVEALIEALPNEDWQSYIRFLQERNKPFPTRKM